MHCITRHNRLAVYYTEVSKLSENIMLLNDRMSELLNSNAVVHSSEQHFPRNVPRQEALKKA